MLQKETNVEGDNFLIFLAGELIGDIFSIVLNIFKKPVNKESAAIIGECLRIFVLLQTLSKVSECQRGVMSLLLEAVKVNFSVREVGFSEGISDGRSIAIKMVSQIVQIPSSAVHFNDVLLSMPVTQRQQLQDIIHSSVAQDQIPTHVKSQSSSPLEIKLPIPSGTQETPPSSSSSAMNPSHGVGVEEEDEEEDDWECFQSFPASANVNSTARNNAPEEEEEDEADSGDDDDDDAGFAAFQTQDNTEGVPSDKDNVEDQSEDEMGESSRGLPVEEEVDELSDSDEISEQHTEGSTTDEKKVAAESHEDDNDDHTDMEKSSVTPPPSESSSNGDSEKQGTTEEKKKKVVESHHDRGEDDHIDVEKPTSESSSDGDSE